jgi:hypothetical protein
MYTIEEFDNATPIDYQGIPQQIIYGSTIPSVQYMECGIVTTLPLVQLEFTYVFSGNQVPVPHSLLLLGSGLLGLASWRRLKKG